MPTSVPLGYAWNHRVAMPTKYVNEKSRFTYHHQPSTITWFHVCI